MSSVSFYHHGTVIDRRAWEQIARFRYLEALAFQGCRLESAVKFCFARPGSMKKLTLCKTPITTSSLRSLSHLSNLEFLWLDGIGLKGDWLKPIANLHNIERLIVDHGDLSGGAADSLGE